ncbi:YybS family protein [Salinibacillus xinjiangensis]|uniref:DUF2232 domain-containing protein n=1 Tax=Salinibacillus xinjiangensis TaxID=1229268 RepID=A0A6G1XAM0_9BACI|nr:YybS family protein [Salinibacillus xinjiangensis]MRG87969.1 DUF2232 domain-containing protein [Salinibacillus xinjiangensis]
MKKSNVITEGALFSGIFIVLLLLTLFVPVIGFFSMFLTPIPFMVFTYKNGIKPGLMMAVVSILLATILATVLSLPLALMAAFGGITIGASLYLKKSTYETWALGSVAFGIGFMAVVFLGQWLFELNMVQEINLLVEQSLQTSKQLMEQFDNTEESIQLLEEQMDQIIYLIPTLIGFLGIFYAFITIWIGFKMINRLEKRSLSFPPFRKFSLPISAVWVYLIAMVLTWVFPEEGSVMNQAFINILTLTGYLFVIQGLAFIFYYVHVKNKSKGIAIAAIIVAILLPFFLYPLRILGIIDLGFNLRERLTPNKE